MGFSVGKGDSTSRPGSGPNSCVTLAGLLYYHMPHVFIGKEVIVPVLILYGSSMINAIINFKIHGTLKMPNKYHYINLQ